VLNSLFIKNFRSLEDFSVPKLGRVNLIVGKNNSGKSSVLEALRIYAGNGNRDLLERIAGEHDENSRFDSTDRGSIPFEAFFSGRRFPDSDDQDIQIGESPTDVNMLRIRHGYVKELQEVIVEDGESIVRTVRRPIPRSELNGDVEGVSPALFISKNEKVFRIRFDLSTYRVRNTFADISAALPCSVVPTQFLNMEELAEDWDKIVLTEHEPLVQEALQIVAPDLIDIAFVRDAEAIGPRRERKRYGKVRLGSLDFPVPLNSMGDGLVRVLQLILKSFPARGGVLLIDEFENGLHYSVQRRVWDLIFDVAIRLDIQVFATTHSWDCIESFSAAAVARQDAEGMLFRIGRSVRKSDEGRVIATAFDETQLSNITQADMEVR
jgi:hypothetical protein